jgi:hypothetical protein
MLPWIVYASGFLIVIATIALGYDNRDSPEILKTASVIVGGVAISLVTMLLFFKDEDVTSDFAVSFIAEPETGFPAPSPVFMPEFPEFSELNATQYERYSISRELAVADPASAAFLVAPLEPNAIRASSPQTDLMTFQIVSALCRKFPHSWRLTGTEPYVYSVLGSDSERVQLDASQTREDQTVIYEPALISLLNENSFVNVGFPGELNLPPKAKLSISKPYPDTQEITISNSFVELHIKVGPPYISKIDPTISPNKNPKNAVVRILSLDANAQYSVVLIPIEIKQTFRGVKRGNPEMQAYRKWSDEVNKLLHSRFDDRAFWAKLTSNYAVKRYPEIENLTTRDGSTESTRAVLAQYRIRFAVKPQTSFGIVGVGDAILSILMRGLLCERLPIWEFRSVQNVERDRSDEEVQIIKRLESYLEGGAVVLIVLPGHAKEEETVKTEILEAFKGFSSTIYTKPAVFKVITFQEFASGIPNDEIKKQINDTKDKIVFLAVS